MTKPEMKTHPEQKGDHILFLLQSPKNLEGIVRSHDSLTIPLTNEDGQEVLWSSFVTFPRELSTSFPGSVIRPDSFLQKLGEDSGNIKHLLGSNKEKGVSFEHQDKKGIFSLTVLHGSTSEYAMNLMRLANQGFSDESVRAQYQQAIAEGIVPALKKEEKPTYGIRIHDDCLASGDSILSYLELQIREGNGVVLRKGVEVVIDGAATAQGILLLKAYAKKHKIPLHITSGYMAYGLSETNYITMPEEVIRMLPENKRQAVRNLAANDGNIYVVGDMGDAEQGISQGVIDRMRAETRNTTYCEFNDTRKDSHGNHPSKSSLPRMDGPIHPEGLNDVYFARGGYLPYALDELYNPQFKETHKIIIRASRVWTKEYGYGATFRPTD